LLSTARISPAKPSSWVWKWPSNFRLSFWRWASFNAKHVARINVELPSPRLRDGVVFVDTPGLGSLASAGATETIAYLPRCDLGVALLDAGDLDGAEQALRQNLALNPKSQSAYFHLGQLYHLRGDEASSRGTYQKAIELDPHTYLAQRARERVEGWRPRLIIGTGHESKEEDK